jgi:hypothetical protein
MTNQEKITALSKAMELIEAVMDTIDPDLEENEELVMFLSNAVGDIADSQNMIE